MIRRAAMQGADMQIDTDNLRGYSADDLAKAKRTIGAELQRHLERLTSVFDLHVPKKRRMRSGHIVVMVKRRDS